MVAELVAESVSVMVETMDAGMAVRSVAEMVG